MTTIKTKYDVNRDGRISDTEVRSKGGYRQLKTDLAAANPKEADAFEPAVRYHYLRENGGAKLLELIGETKGAKHVDQKALELKRAIDALDPAGEAVAKGYVDGDQRRVLRDLDFVAYDPKSRVWSYRDPLADAAPLSRTVTQLRTVDSPGNPAYSASGDLYTSIQSGGRFQPAPAFHIGKLNPATGKLEAFPSAEYQKKLGAVLGLRVLPKPGGGELLVGIDWKKSRFFAIDLATKQEVTSRELPNPFIQQLLPAAAGAASMHNDLALVGDTFYISNPSRKSIGVLKPDGSFSEVLKGDRSTAAGDTDLIVGGKNIKLAVLPGVKIPFQSGVDSIAYTEDLMGKGPHLLFSPLTPDGAARLWAAPVVNGAVGAAHPVARVPINDGFSVATIKGRQYLFGSDVQGSGAFVMSLDTLKAAPLVKDPRIGWADGMTVRVDEAAGRVRATFANSGLGHSLGGDAPPAADRGLYTVDLSIDELVAKLDALEAPKYNDAL